MDEQSTTTPTEETGAITAQPAETEAVAADTSTNDTEATSQQTPSEPSEDDQLEAWASNKGVTLDSANAISLAKMAREAERAMHGKAKKASELEKSLATSSDAIAEEVAIQTGQDPELLKRLQRVEVRDAVRDFYDTNPDARKFEQQMIEEVQRRPHLAGDLEALYAVVSRDAVKSQGSREALETLAQKQKAAVPRGNAVNGAKMQPSAITAQNVDEMVANMSPEEYRRRLPEINAVI